MLSKSAKPSTVRCIFTNSLTVSFLRLFSSNFELISSEKMQNRCIITNFLNHNILQFFLVKLKVSAVKKFKPVAFSRNILFQNSRKLWRWTVHLFNVLSVCHVCSKLSLRINHVQSCNDRSSTRYNPNKILRYMCIYILNSNGGLK